MEQAELGTHLAERPLPIRRDGEGIGRAKLSSVKTSAAVKHKAEDQLVIVRFELDRGGACGPERPRFQPQRLQELRHTVEILRQLAPAALSPPRRHPYNSTERA